MDVPVQQHCAAEPERCYFGNAPSLSEMKIAFNREFTAAWIARHLQSILATLGDKDNVPAEVIGLLAQDILANYSWMTASEFMLFCSRVRVGRYGKLAYGQVSVDDITSKIPQFLEERDKEMTRYARQRAEKERDRELAEWQERSVSHEDGMRLINAAADGDANAQALLGDNPDAWINRIYFIEWLDVDPERKQKISQYFGIYEHPSKKTIVVVPEERYEKLLEGEKRGYYKLYI